MFYEIDGIIKFQSWIFLEIAMLPLW